MNALYVIAGTVAAGSATLMLAASAEAAPAGPQDVNAVVMQLQESGNTVVINRTGDGALSQCTLTGVRAGHTYTRYDSGYPGAQMDPMSQVVGMTVYVDAQC